MGSVKPRSQERGPEEETDGYCKMGTGVSGVMWVCACVRGKATA